MVTSIPLTQGKVALVDDEDAASVSQFKWRALRCNRKNGEDNFYAIRTVSINGRETTQAMHKLLLPGQGTVDHKDGDGLNNQRSSNLRPASVTLNHANRIMLPSGKTSRFRGVCWARTRGKWQAAITINKKPKALGRFHLEEDAARAYDRAAKVAFGDFARLNFPGETVEIERDGNIDFEATSAAWAEAYTRVEAECIRRDELEGRARKYYG